MNSIGKCIICTQLIGRRLTWKYVSMSSMFGFLLFLRRVYMDMTMPGVQNPHWEPWELAIRSCTACNLVLKRVQGQNTIVQFRTRTITYWLSNLYFIDAHRPGLSQRIFYFCENVLRILNIQFILIKCVVREIGALSYKLGKTLNFFKFRL